MAEGRTPGLKARSFPGAPPGSETTARLQGGHPGTWEALSSPLSEGTGGTTDAREDRSGKRPLEPILTC